MRIFMTILYRQIQTHDSNIFSATYLAKLYLASTNITHISSIFILFRAYSLNLFVFNHQSSVLSSLRSSRYAISIFFIDTICISVKLINLLELILEDIINLTFAFDKTLPNCSQASICIHFISYYTLTYTVFVSSRYSSFFIPIFMLKVQARSCQ